MSRSHRSACCILALACSLVLQGGGIAAFAQSIPWLGGASKLPSSTDLDLALKNAPRAADGSLHAVVQFDGPADATRRAAMSERGVEILQYVGANAYFARIQPGSAGISALTATPGVLGISPVQLAWKLHPSLAAGDLPDWTIVPASKTREQRVAVYAVFHADVDLEGRGVPLAQSFAAIVRDRMPGINGLVLEIPAARIAELAAVDAVQWIEPALPQLDVTNDQAREITQTDTVQAPPYELDGNGVTVMVFDGGVARSTHVDFQGRLSVGDTSGVIMHATHVAGTIGGAGVANPTYRGMAPAVQLLSYGIQAAGGAGLYTNPGDLEADYRRAIADGAIISNNSIGTNVESNGFDCAWQGDYGATSALIDAIVCGSLGDPFRIIWAGGNERTSSRCDVEGFGDFYSIPPPSGAKNHISIGAVNSNNSLIASFSSWGPTDDGRLKPDLCAPGSQVAGDFGITSCSSDSDTAYKSMSGTSMASPVVCGISALLLQDFRTQFPGQALPRNSTLKALFAQTSIDLGEIGPDYKYGYGLVQIENAIGLLRASGFTENSLAQGESYVRTVTVAVNDPEFKVTLAWDDVPGTPNVSPSLVNDLDLRVIDPNGVRHYPWTLDPQNPSFAALQTLEDHINNIEQVLVENPMPGDWTIEVYGHNVPQGPQSFSLAGDGAMNVITFFTFPDGRPNLLTAGLPFDLNVQITSFNDAFDPGTAMLHYRVDGGDFETTQLTQVAPGRYVATLPARLCDESPEYYLSVQTASLGVITSPASAPAALHAYQVGDWMPLLADSFDEDLGWTVDAGAYSGNWERADPEEVINVGVITQPGDDHTPGDANGLCYVTGPLAGPSVSYYDVDGGPSILTSPVFDLSDSDGLVSYWRWFHISLQMDDALMVSVSNNGTDWVIVEKVVRTAQEWAYTEWRVSDYVTPTATVQVRFSIADMDPGSLLEALVDDFAVQELTCTLALPGDIDGDNDVDYADYVIFLSAFGGPVDGNPPQDADCDYDHSGAVGLADYNAWLEYYRDFIGDPFAGPPSAPGAPTPGLNGQGGLQKKKLPAAGSAGAAQPAAGNTPASGAIKKMSR